MNRATSEELVFEALPPARGRGFATTWWGRSWLKALEDTALDGERLRQGRRHARAGAVGAVSVRPGRLTAVVKAGDGTGHRADVLLRQLSDREWDRLLHTVAGEGGHIAALLDREMSPQLVADAAAAGVDLLPGIGDLEPECECGEWDHCAHTAALSYQVARLLDTDPFLLLLLRGRGEQELTDELQRRSAARAEPAGNAAAQPAGVPAAESYARWAAGPLPLPAPPPRVAEPGTGPALGGGVPPADGLDVGALEFLVADTAARAARLLAAALGPGHAQEAQPAPLGEWQDAVRMATAGPAAHIAARLAAGCDRSALDLDLAVRAWRFGGRPALAALEEQPGEVPAAALGQLAAAWAGEESRPVLRGGDGRWTVVGEGVQLRWGPDGRWWPFLKSRGRWWPAGPAESEPAAALAAARGGGGGGRSVAVDGAGAAEPRQARSSNTA
ncbi:SWIM zinc finger family protein [Streptomyces johnsoniae]|uniref:SWF or SNF family helicase n=1 Tax=Streptomyces johnsoniae TaxID=3075532 RepID=A0ABU2S6L4_9ACTN|nr:SWF or SNF family helicase [Streptomyces sp. DSM 41886]MDT0444624.1 SWF or SNF family helicase [Streptomyces sp. DSM 41886]